MQEHVARNYGSFSSIKTHASTGIRPAHVWIILLACDQIRASLCGGGSAAFLLFMASPQEQGASSPAGDAAELSLILLTGSAVSKASSIPLVAVRLCA